MPMIWNAEADAKLLAAILEVYNVKTSGEGLKEVAAIMGPECTAKACTHRLLKIRGMAGGNSSPSKPKATPIKKTPTRGKKTTNSKQQASSDVSDNEGNEVTPPTSRPKRSGTKRNYAQLNGEDSDSNGEGSGNDSNDDVHGEEGEEGMKKKKEVKIEVDEDIGEGLRAGAEDANDYTF